MKEKNKGFIERAVRMNVKGKERVIYVSGRGNTYSLYIISDGSVNLDSSQLMRSYIGTTLIDTDGKYLYVANFSKYISIYRYSIVIKRGMYVLKKEWKFERKAEERLLDFMVAKNGKICFEIETKDKSNYFEIYNDNFIHYNYLYGVPKVRYGKYDLLTSAYLPKEVLNFLGIEGETSGKESLFPEAFLYDAQGDENIILKDEYIIFQKGGIIYKCLVTCDVITSISLSGKDLIVVEDGRKITILNDIYRKYA